MPSGNVVFNRRKVLLIAFHYPPCAVSSGAQRTRAFSVNLPSHGWWPTVLTVKPSAYERVSLQQMQGLPQGLEVVRTFAPDVGRHLAWRGRYWPRLALPDRWRGWWLTAVPAGLKLIRRGGIDAIWTTYPIATAHAVGATLARVTGLPWIADFRDPMVEHFPDTGETFPRDPALRRARLRIEEQAVRGAARLVFCTERAQRIVADRYGSTDERRLQVIPNGYDEQEFRQAESLVASLARSDRRVLLHSGTVYPGADRDPSALLKAVRKLADAGNISPQDLEVRFREPAHEDYVRRLAAELGVSDFVAILPGLPYREALAEMLAADALLLLQGYTSNPAVPAKLYEYLRARRPILALVHPDGETARTLSDLGIRTRAELTDCDGVTCLLAEWLSNPEGITRNLPPPKLVSLYSRERQAQSLAALLDAVMAERSHLPGLSRSNSAP